MRHIESIYSLEDIFTRFLEAADKKGFLIPAYQRGYKWSSRDGKGQVNILLKDLLKAFELKKDTYYLQFLTLKNNNDELEVIDGQQRLTTLTILYSVISDLSAGKGDFVLDKLNYQARQNFIRKFIYENIAAMLSTSDWKAFCDANEGFDNQDTFYIYHAAKAIERFLKNTVKERLEMFVGYLNRNVMLIINVLPDDLNSEKVFVNVNKGVKLGDEDLVKGLLITKLPKDFDDYRLRRTETEINEARASIGRQWDELSGWSSREKIRTFYNRTESPERMSWLIAQVFPDTDPEGSEHPVFEYLDRLYTDRKLTASEMFAKIKEMKMSLNDWYLIPEIHNLLGFFLRNGGGKYYLKIEAVNRLMKLPKSEVLKNVKNFCLGVLPVNQQTGEIKELNFQDDKSEIFNLFLMMDVAKFLPVGSQKLALYDFSNISDRQWSIEHIFPQTSKDFRKLEVLSAEDLDFLKEILPDSESGLKSDNAEFDKAVRKLYLKISDAGASCRLDSAEVKILEKLLAGNASALHTIGNLALLPGNINSGLSNHYFNEKRRRLVKKVGNGEFVPFHTYDVFSKLILTNNTKLNIWSKDDIDAHEQYIKTRIKDIVNYLKG